LVALPFTIFSQDRSTSDCGQFETYIVKDGESLRDISLRFGSDRFEEIIYSYNADLISDRDSLQAGIELIIPINIAQFAESGLPLDVVLHNPACLPDADDSAVESRELSDQEMLNKFREAFRELTEEKTDTVVDESHVEAEKDILTGISGMVIDETRSKIGRDFYDLFYQNWTAPEEVSGFTITITEQPAPGLGTIISVKANDTETFKYRLQPRYDFIQQAALYAVRLTYNYLKNNPQDFVIY
jgi:curli production assembly/transport component CsgE